MSNVQMGAGAVNIIMLPSLLIPVTWFPDHKGLVSRHQNPQPVTLGRQVLGIVTSGFGLSSTVFSPLQTLLINPSNLPPLRVKLIQNRRRCQIEVQVESGMRPKSKVAFQGYNWHFLHTFI